MNAWARKLGEIYAGLLQLHGHGHAPSPRARGGNARTPVARRTRPAQIRTGATPHIALGAWSGR